MRITSMQHDGVVATGGAMSMSEAEAGTTDAATQACGFTVEVVAARFMNTAGIPAYYVLIRIMY